MTVFRTFLAIMFLAILAYTIVTITTEGWNLLPVFFGDIYAMKWPGQFNFDFACLLIISGAFVRWREGGGLRGTALGLLALFGGALFLSAYLFFKSANVSSIRDLLVPINTH